MSLKQTITEEMKQAMRDRNTEKLGTLRLLLSELKNFEIDHGEQDDAGVQKIVQRMIKQWKDAINDYKSGGRDDLVAEAESKITVLEEFMPEQMSEEDLRKIVEEVVAQSGQDKPGPVIGMVMKKVGSQADGGLVAKLVNQVLNG